MVHSRASKYNRNVYYNSMGAGKYQSPQYISREAMDKLYDSINKRVQALYEKAGIKVEQKATSTCEQTEFIDKERVYVMSNDNLKIYDAVRAVPKEAQKPIAGGRLKGKTDINPMWRIKALTEQFGACGFGWKYEILDMQIQPTNSEECAAFVKINLYVKYNGEWSEPIPGVGGNMFLEQETKGIHINDDCYKMALTDAISVACKALGFGADIYWESDKSKHDNTSETESPEYKCESCRTPFKNLKAPDGTKYTAEQLYNGAKEKCGGKALCRKCQNTQVPDTEASA